MEKYWLAENRVNELKAQGVDPDVERPNLMNQRMPQNNVSVGELAQQDPELQYVLEEWVRAKRNKDFFALLLLEVLEELTLWAEPCKLHLWDRLQLDLQVLAVVWV